MWSLPHNRDICMWFDWRRCYCSVLLLYNVWLFVSEKSRNQFVCWCRYIFVCNDWIKVRRDMSKRHAKTLKLESVEESHLSVVQSTHYSCRARGCPPLAHFCLSFLLSLLLHFTLFPSPGRLAGVTERLTAGPWVFYAALPHRRPHYTFQPVRLSGPCRTLTRKRKTIGLQRWQQNIPIQKYE